MVDQFETGTTRLEVRSVDKRFGATYALQDVSLDVLQGEVHALLGHNGSGKSTLVKIISGLLSPDTGTVSVKGRSGSRARLGIVHQDLALCLGATVLENCCMAGYQVDRFYLIDWLAERRSLEPLLESLMADFNCDAMVQDLSPADQAVVAIARALKGMPGSTDLDLLVLDEATARLRGRDADKVLSTARLVAGRGGGVLLVTHHMNEVLHAADRATVLSSGKVAGTVKVADTTEDALIELVSGQRLPVNREESVRRRRRAAPEVLVVRGLTGDWVSNVTLAAASGEIVGLTGAAGAGHEEMPYLLSGARSSHKGEILLSGRRLRARDVSSSRRQGLGLVPADRLAQGLLNIASIRENLSPLVRRRHTRLGFVASKHERRWADEVCVAFDVRPPDPDALMSTLSGGNQQKVLLARTLEDRPKVLVLHEPTQGVDEATRRALVQLVRRAADDGAVVLYVSSDIDEVASSSDRVLVFRKGAVVAEFEGGLGNVDNIYAACYLNGSGRERASDMPAITKGKP